jgi:hypothetical protein
MKHNVVLTPRHVGLFCLACTVLAGAILPCTATADWMINFEYKQQDTTGRNRVATDFDLRIKGDVRGRITGGGTDAATNAFPDPKVEATLPDGTNTRVRFSSGIPPQEGGNIPPNPDTGRHFGISGIGEKPKVFEKSWSYGSNPFSITLPEVETSFLFNPGTRQLVVTGVNQTEDTVRFSQAGFLLTNTPFALQDLNRTHLPPSAFLPLSPLDGEYEPGQSRSVTLTDVMATDFIVTFGTFVFSGASSGNPYTLDGSEWTQVDVASAVPEPGTLTLVITVIVGITMTTGWWRFRRRDI